MMRISDLPDINPYNTLVFIHRELILYNNRIIFEYLEERYHPQNKLLPENPIEKAPCNPIMVAHWERLD